MNKKQVLIVTNTISESELVQIQNSFNHGFAKDENINLCLVHVIPRLPTCYFNIPSMAALIDSYHKDAKRTLKYISEQLNVAKHDQWLISGNIRTEVLRLATALDANFVLAGAKQLAELKRSLFFKEIRNCSELIDLNPVPQL